MKYLLKLFMIVGAIITLAACCKTVEGPDSGGDIRLFSNLNIVPVWTDSVDIPSGIRVVFYNLEKGTFYTDNLPATGGVTKIAEGNYSLLVYNNNTEKILFQDATQYDSHSAHTSQMSIMYSGSKSTIQYYSRAVLTNQANLVSYSGDDTLFSGTAYGQPESFWINSLDSYAVAAGDNTLYVYPKQLVKRYQINVYVENLKYLTGGSGIVTGMVTSIKMKDGEMKDIPGTLVASTRKMDNGVSFVFESFGVAADTLGVKDDSYTHNLIFELNTTTKNYKYKVDVTRQMDSIRNGGEFSLYDKIVIPEELSGNGGFVVENEGWDDEIVIPIPLKP